MGNGFRIVSIEILVTEECELKIQRQRSSKTKKIWAMLKTTIDKQKTQNTILSDIEYYQRQSEQSHRFWQ